METEINSVLFHEQTIFSRLDTLACEITRDYKDKELTVLSLLNGSFIFMADLLRRINLPLQVESLSVSSYNGITSTGQVNFRQHEIKNINNRHLLIIDDILDSGLTMRAVIKRISENYNPISIKTCVLLKKNIKRDVDVNANYVAFEIPDVFVVGYGLDYNEQYRNLPYIGELGEVGIQKYKKTYDT